MLCHNPNQNIELKNDNMESFKRYYFWSFIKFNDCLKSSNETI